MPSHTQEHEMEIETITHTLNEEDAEEYEPMEPIVNREPRPISVIEIKKVNQSAPMPINLPSIKKQTSMGIVISDTKLDILPRWTLSVGTKIIVKENKKEKKIVQVEEKRKWDSNNIPVHDNDTSDWTIVSRKKNGKPKNPLLSTSDFPELGKKSVVVNSRPKTRRRSNGVEVSRTKIIPQHSRTKIIPQQHLKNQNVCQIQIRVPKHLYERANAYLSSIKTSKSIKIIPI